MENVIVTPHYSYATPHQLDRLIALFTETCAGIRAVNR